MRSALFVLLAIPLAAQSPEAGRAGAGAWLAPTSVLTPRFVKVGAQIDF